MSYIANSANVEAHRADKLTILIDNFNAADGDLLDMVQRLANDVELKLADGKINDAFEALLNYTPETKFEKQMYVEFLLKKFVTSEYTSPQVKERISSKIIALV